MPAELLPHAAITLTITLQNINNLCISILLAYECQHCTIKVLSGFVIALKSPASHWHIAGYIFVQMVTCLFKWVSAGMWQEVAAAV